MIAPVGNRSGDGHDLRCVQSDRSMLAPALKAYLAYVHAHVSASGGREANERDKTRER